MADGIQWTIDLDAKTGGAAETIQAFDRIQSRAEAADRAVDRVLNRVEKLARGVGNDAGWSKGAMNLHTLTKGAQLSEREFGYVKRQTELANKELQNLGHTENTTEPLWRSVFKGQLAMEALKTTARLTWEAIKWGAHEAAHAFETAAGEERTRGVFRNVLGADDGKATLDYLDKFGGMAEFTRGQLVEMSTGLLQAGLRGADFRNAIGAAADVAATSTNKIEGYSGAVASLERIYRTGRIEGRALAGLHLKSAEVEGQVSKDTGLDRKTIKKRLEAGTLDAREAMASIYTVMEQKSGKKLGALGVEMAGNVQSKLEKIKDIPEEIFKSLVDGPGFARISEALDSILDAFGPGSEAGKAIREGLGELMEFVGTSIKEINWRQVGESFKDLVELSKEWAPVVKTIAEGIAGIAHAILLIPRMGAGIGDWLAGGSVAAPFHEANQRKLDAMGDANERAFAEAEAENSGASVEKARIKGARDETHTHSPSADWADFGRDCAEGFALGFASPPPVASVPSIGSLPPVGGGRGGLTVGDLHLAVTVQVPGTSATPEEITESVGQQLPSMLLAALEQLNTQAGLA